MKGGKKGLLSFRLLIAYREEKKTPSKPYTVRQRAIHTFRLSSRRGRFQCTIQWCCWLCASYRSEKMLIFPSVLLFITFSRLLTTSSEYFLRACECVCWVMCVRVVQHEWHEKMLIIKWKNKNKKTKIKKKRNFYPTLLHHVLICTKSIQSRLVGRSVFMSACCTFELRARYHL